MLGYGESDDPLPERVQYTRFRVFAGHCQKCGCAGRKLLPAGSDLVLICDSCAAQQNTSLKIEDLPEITYIYWCNGSRFASDEVVLPEVDRHAVEELLHRMAENYEAPHWAVTIIGGRCSSSELCLRHDCPYLVKSQ